MLFSSATLDSETRPHAFAYVEGKYAVDQHFQRIDGPTNHNVSADKVIVNHYFTKSLEVRRPFCGCP